MPIITQPVRSLQLLPILPLLPFLVFLWEVLLEMLFTPALMDIRRIIDGGVPAPLAQTC
jgi:hypothetical protein